MKVCFHLAKAVAVGRIQGTTLARASRGAGGSGRLELQVVRVCENQRITTRNLEPEARAR